MPLIEVDEEEVRKARSLRDTVAAIWNDPTTKLEFQKVVKKKFPGAVTPELDAAAVVESQTGGVTKEVEELKKQIAADKAEREQQDKLRSLETNYAAGFDKLRRNGWTEEGIEGVKKIMEEKGILDHDIAAAYFEKQHPPQDLISPNGRTGAWNFMDDVREDESDLKKLIESKGENNALLDKMAREALTEVRGQSRR